MIYTVTLSPALDYLIWLEHFEPGALNRSSLTAFRAGGKGINVSAVLNRLGFSSICLGFTAGFVGDELVRMLEADGIRHDFIRVGNGCTRINVKIKSDTESEINASGPRISDTELTELEKKAGKLTSGDILILSGKPPKGIPDDIYSVLIDAVSDRNVKIVVDTSGNNLLAALQKHPYLIKPNRDELEEVCGSDLTSIGQVAAAALRLRERGAQNVLVSLGPEGALLAADDGCVYTCGIAEGKLIDSTGAGDSMVAGFIAKDLSHENRGECLRYAVACGCASAYSYELLDPESLEQVYSRMPFPKMLSSKEIL